MPFKIKICGITLPSDAKFASECGADAIGLNFYPKSMRSVDLDKAKHIASANPGLIKVGVFVNENASKINEIVGTVGLDLVQLHGDEEAGIIAEIEADVVRAVRIIEGDFQNASSEAKTWTEAGAEAILLDAGSGSSFGGTGLRLDWKKVSQLSFAKPLILAGGLNCDNVSQAISMAKPHGVDVASGIEKFPGAKDSELLNRFVINAKNSLQSP